MKKEIELTIHPDLVEDYSYRIQLAAKKLHINPDEITTVQVIRKSIDARGKTPHFILRSIVYINENPDDIFQPIVFEPVQSKQKAIIIGSGPAGLFAAMRLIELGIKPVIFERGKNVRDRRKDLRAIQQFHQVNPDSNYCFGEGGAGTYSDGKLYTRSTKRGDVKRILNLLVQNGSPRDILVDAHPHIGSNRLPEVVQSIRETIINNGGEVHFDSRVTDIIIERNQVKSVIVNGELEMNCNALIIAAGHSARDIYYLLRSKKILLESKSFAMGVRIEHPQKLIDNIQYKMKTRHKNLPASSYNLACQIDERGVYSFCMCPGGIIIPASTDANELVLNGMSVSRRDSPYANSGLVVTITEEDWKEFNQYEIFAGLEYQKHIEYLAFVAGGKTQTAPAQRITDFVAEKLSTSLPGTSFIPGTISSPLHEILPKNISGRLKKSLVMFDKKMKGYYTEEAQILAAETRTSSPIRIPRDSNTMMHPQVHGLFPSGEGAGYAGGIVSAAIDGERCAEAAVKFIGQNSIQS